jgi:hypothetical protein
LWGEKVEEEKNYSQNREEKATVSLYLILIPSKKSWIRPSESRWRKAYLPCPVKEIFKIFETTTTTTTLFEIIILITDKEDDTGTGRELGKTDDNIHPSLSCNWSQIILQQEQSQFTLFLTQK